MQLIALRALYQALLELEAVLELHFTLVSIH